MPLPDTIVRLVVAAQRRLTLRRTIVAALAAIAVGGLIGSVVLAIARLHVLEWAQPAALLLVGSCVVLAIGYTLFRRPSTRQAAIEVDNRLESRDLVATSLEIVGRSQLTDAELRQLRHSEAWASGRNARSVASLRPPWQLALVAVVAASAALALALFPSAADAAASEQAAIRAAIDAVADQIESEIPDLPELPADRLEELVEELREAPDFERALAELAEARQELGEHQQSDVLARRTAQAGLERTLQDAGAGEGSPADQLSQLAARLDQLSDEERSDLASALDQAASDVAGIEPDLAEALSAAAAAVADGGGGEELRTASDRAAAAADSLTDAEAVAGAQAQLRDAQQALAGAAGGQGQGEGQGQGQGQGEGQGQGQGQGQGGQGGGGGGGSGANNPGAAPGGSGSGTDVPRGGENDPDPLADPVRGEIADVVAVEAAEQIRVDIAGNELGDVAGQVEGEGLRNLPLVPYSEQFSSYQQQALDALDALVIPPSLSELIKSYYQELEP